MDNHITFGQRLKRLRVSRGTSVAELAQASDTSEATIRAFEKTSTMRELLVGLKIAVVLNVEPVVLALGDIGEIVARVDDLDRRVAAIEGERRLPG